MIASFVLDVVFLDGLTEVSEGEQAAALIMVFLLWRVLRIVNGPHSACTITPIVRNQTLVSGCQIFHDEIREILARRSIQVQSAQCVDI